MDESRTPETTRAAIAADASTLDQLESELTAIEDAVERIEAGDLGAVEALAPTGPTASDARIVAPDGPLQSRPPEREEHAMGFALDKLGQWTEGPEFKVEADRTKAYAAATNDPAGLTASRSTSSSSGFPRTGPGAAGAAMRIHNRQIGS